MTTPAPRPPKADNPRVLSEFCTCVWVYRQNPEDPQGPAVGTRNHTNPTCELHGDHVKEAPF